MTTSAGLAVDSIVPEEFDLVVLGTGKGAKYLAWTLAKQGKRVASVEERSIGGSCPNVACLPSKVPTPLWLQYLDSPRHNRSPILKR